MKLNIFFLCFITLATTIGCKNQDQKLNPIINAPSDYTAIEIYCFCIDEVKTKYQNFYEGCETPFHISPQQVIGFGRLVYATDDTLKIHGIKKFFFQGHHNTDTSSASIDSRFVVLFRKDRLNADTLILNSSDGYSFSFNEKITFKYSFDAIDSAEKFLARKITCPDVQ